MPIWCTYGYAFAKSTSIASIKGEGSNDESIITFILYGLGTTRILRPHRLESLLPYVFKNHVDIIIGKLFIFISLMILFFAAVMQFLESSSQPYKFHTWMYYVVVTIATIGYGDISPMTTPGRVAAMIMILYSMVVIPEKINKLLEQMTLSSRFARAAFVPRWLSNHVVVCGYCHSVSLRTFFEELFHDDHCKDTDLRAVIMLPEEPTREVRMLLQDRAFKFNITYLMGSVLIEGDMRRARLDIASAVFVLSDKYSPNADIEDTKIILLNLSMQRFVKNEKFVSFMQLIRPENARHVTSRRSRVVCLNNFKMGILAKGLCYPGATALLMNLTSSFSAPQVNPSDPAWLK